MPTFQIALFVIATILVCFITINMVYFNDYRYHSTKWKKLNKKRTIIESLFYASTIAIFVGYIVYLLCVRV